MSAQGIADAVVKAVRDNTFDVMVVNFANADMVGHSGKIPPTIIAVETVDGCLGQVYSALRQQGGAMIVTADHGNAEQMIDPATGGPQTAHTTNPVPFIVCTENAVTPANFKGDPRRFTLRPDGALQDIAPTMLGILGLPQPKEMTGRDLRIFAEQAKR
jgi:2,3-bisphosphoglycerate-independent phosphoglycerate mutase